MKVLFVLFMAVGLASAQDGGCTASGMGPYDYSQALCMSFLFYEAQRSGFLPDDERLDWRWYSALGDGSDNGLDLTGGYYDAGDFVKFGFPMAFSATALAWGMIEYPTGYSRSGQTDYGKAAVKWATDYFLKAHNGQYELYGQVGDGNTDHAYWGRPEEMTMYRPSWKIDPNCPGSDLAGETSAALAAAYILFKDTDPTYAATCLASARELFDFADIYRGTYDQCITNAASFYKSWSGYGDELAWSAAWLYKATGESTYLDKANGFVSEFGLEYYAETFDWDSKTAGVYAMMAELDGSYTLEDGRTYTQVLTDYVDHIRNEKYYSPGGMVYMDRWGTLRHACNVAFIAARAASLGLNTDTYNAFAQSQIDYALGSNGHSFVVGFGNNPPERPHHRSSSCPDMPATCDYSYETMDAANPQTLFGGLVGGPDQSDNYIDDRTDYVHNEVACDYNACFSGLLAAMVELH